MDAMRRRVEAAWTGVDIGGIVRWWVNRTGQAEGPFDEDAVVAMIVSGQITNANVCPEGGTGWAQVWTVPRFAAAARPQPAARPRASRSLLPLIAVALLSVPACGVAAFVAIGIGILPSPWQETSSRPPATRATSSDGPPAETPSAEPPDDELSHEPAAPAAAITITQRVPTSAAAECVGERSCRISWIGGTLSVSAEEGSVATIGATTVTLTSWSEQTALPIDRLLAETDVPDVMRIRARAPSYAVPVGLTFPDGVRAAGSLALTANDVRYRICERLREALRGPVAFEGESTSVATLVFTERERGRPTCSRVVGGYRRIADLQYVAHARARTSRRSCGTYGNGRTRLDLELTDWTVTIHRRSTGAVVARREHLADRDACPSAIGGGGRGAVSSSVDEETIDAWIRTETQ